MAADDPGTSRGAHWAHEGEPGRPEVARAEIAEVVEVGPEGVAGLDIAEVTQTPAPAPAPPPLAQPPYAQPPQAQPQYAQPPYASPQPPQYPYPQGQPQPQPYPQGQPQPQPYPHGQPQPSAAYPQPPAGYPQPSAAYPQPSAGYPQPPGAFPQPPAGYPQPPTYPQQPFYGWGAQAPLPPAQPKVSLPRRTLAIASAIVVIAVLALAVGLVMAQPSGGAAAKRTSGAAAQDEAARAVWRSATVEQLLPTSIKREGTETYLRLGIDPDESCAKLPAAFTRELAPTKCTHVLSATYADRTQTVTATVGIVVLSGSVADRLRFFQTWTPDSNANNAAMMPHAYPVPRTIAAQFTDAQRVTWQSQASSDGTYLVYAVAGFTDGRSGPGAAAMAASSGSALSSSSPAVQVAGDLPAAIQDLLSTRIQDSQDGAS